MRHTTDLQPDDVTFLREAYEVMAERDKLLPHAFTGILAGLVDHDADVLADLRAATQAMQEGRELPAAAMRSQPMAVFSHLWAASGNSGSPASLDSTGGAS